MGLFSKKPKELEYDVQECQSKKIKMRQMFNEAVEDGDSYAILHVTQSSSRYERGFVMDTNITTFYHYILGYRKSDDTIVMVQVDRELTQHSEGFWIEMDAVVGASYEPKYYQACLHYKKGYESLYEILNIGDTGSKTVAGITNTVQKEEREAFLDYLEELRSKREQAGYKQEKWKR